MQVGRFGRVSGARSHLDGRRTGWTAGLWTAAAAVDGRARPDPDTLVETDTRSSMVTTWTLHPADAGLTTVRVRTTWDGASGIGGFFERTFAPKGLRRVYEELLGRLDREVAPS